MAFVLVVIGCDVNGYLTNIMSVVSDEENVGMLPVFGSSRNSDLDLDLCI